MKEAFDTNWIAPLGANVDGFERDLEAYTGSGHAAALSSGTAALHLGLKLLGVKAVIADHLVRFSWREPVSVTWIEPAA